MEIQKLIQALDKVIIGFEEFKSVLEEDIEQVVDLSAQATVPELKLEELLPLDTFEKLKIALHSDLWPQALRDNHICDFNSEEEKIERGMGIIEVLIEEDLNNLNFLDYGCGEGHTALAAARNNAKISVGYDIEQKKWTSATEENLKLTSSFDEVKAGAPYDIILLYDVLDHLVGELPVTTLLKVKDLLKDNGKIYVRTHPFTSRHATHLYHDINKAYLHLIFTDEELNQLLEKPATYGQHNLGAIRPLAEYDSYFEEAKLTVIHRKLHRESPETFFTAPGILERIKKNVKTNDFPEWQLSLQWIDYVLGKKSDD